MRVLRNTTAVDDLTTLASVAYEISGSPDAAIHALQRANPRLEDFTNGIPSLTYVYVPFQPGARPSANTETFGSTASARREKIQKALERYEARLLGNAKERSNGRRRVSAVTKSEAVMAAARERGWRTEAALLRLRENMETTEDDDSKRLQRVQKAITDLTTDLERLGARLRSR
jgi:hypothetical protein